MYVYIVRFEKSSNNCYIVNGLLLANVYVTIILTERNIYILVPKSELLLYLCHEMCLTRQRPGIIMFISPTAKVQYWVLLATCLMRTILV